MTAASRSLATALLGARFASGLLPKCYTTSGDATGLKRHRERQPQKQRDLQARPNGRISSRFHEEAHHQN